ncbi:MAG: alcohol dehydrogenase class [Acidimicrobiales bacterium]|nr:alcohol dehydrogenase class [Acidimicrobiales bacterium]
MRAAVLHEVPGHLSIDEVEIDAPARREVLIRNVAAGLCHSDLHFMDGKFAAPTPSVLGHESAGVVEAVGSDVTYVKPGDHVITCVSAFCGQCNYCLSGRQTLCNRAGTERASGQASRLTIAGESCGQFIGLGSFAEKMLVHEHTVVKVPDEMPLDRAALIGCGVVTGVGAVFRSARVEPGSTVAVIGCGGIGLNCVQGAILAGATRVVAVDTNPAKLDLAKLFGATDTVDAAAGDPVREIRKRLGGVDYSFEAIGLKATVEQAFAMLRKGGTATVIGMMPPGVSIELPGIDFLTGEKTIRGTNMGSNRFREDMPRLVDLYLQGRLKLDELISTRIALEDINDGFAALSRGEVARSVIIF